MLLPLYSFLEGDTLGVLVLVQDTTRVGDLADIARRSAAVRVAASGPMRVLFRGETLDPDAILADVGIRALDRVDVSFGGPSVL